MMSPPTNARLDPRQPVTSLASPRSGDSEDELEQRCRREVLAFSWPVMTELLLMSLINMASLAMVGGLGTKAISIVGLTNQPVMIFMAVFQAFNVGATALVARAIGGQDQAGARAVAVQTVAIACGVSLVLAGLGLLFSEAIMAGMGAGPDILQEGTRYMMYMSVAVVFQGLPTSVAAILRGAGETEAPMRYNVISNVVNVVLGILLIQGFAGSPSLGLEGAAIATVVARAVSFFLAVKALLRPDLPLALAWNTPLRAEPEILRRIGQIGLSAAGEQLFSRLGLLLYTRIVAELGTTAVAAHQINLTVASLAFNGVTALSAASSSFVGRSLGKQDAELGERYWREALFQGYVFSLAMGVLFFFGGRQLSSLFSKDPEVITLSCQILMVNAVLNMPQCTFTIIAGGLRGAGDTRYPMVAALVGTLGVRVLLAMLFVVVFQLGLLGAWAAAVVDQSVRAVLIYRRFQSGRWRHQKV